MNVALNILTGPLDLGFYILHQLQKTFFMVNGSFMGHQPLGAAVLGRVVGRLAWWALLTILMAAVIYWTVKYVLESVFSGPLTSKDILPVLASVFWRLVAILLIYAAISFLLYAFTSYGHLISSGMNLPRMKLIR